jgi:nucleoside-diphosphate-sugar epimerase
MLEAVRGLTSLRSLSNLSTSSVYGCDATGDETAVPEPTSYYGVTRLAAGRVCLAYTRDQGLAA